MPSNRRYRIWPHEDQNLISRPNYSLLAIIVWLAVGIIGLMNMRPHSHAIVFEVPTYNGIGHPFEPWPADLPTHRLSLTALDQILWDGEHVTQPELLDKIDVALAAEPRQAIVFEPEAYASYDLSARVMNMLVESGATSQYFCLAGLRQYAHTADERHTVRIMTSIFMDSEWRLERIDPDEMPQCDPAPLVVE